MSYSYETIVDKANKIKTNVEKDYKIGESTGWTYYICKEVIQRTKTVPKISFSGAGQSQGNDLSRQITQEHYLDMAKRLVKFVENNHKLPNYVSYGKYKVRVSDYTYMFARILAYYDNKKKLPAYVNVNSKAFTKPSESTNDVYDYFVQLFGKISCIDDALEKIAGRGYGYYYDDVYSNKQSIDRIKQGLGINCTDATQMMKNVADGTGKYKSVDCVHVKCSGGDGHVFLRITAKDNSVFYRDPAAVLDSGSVTHIWCLNGTVLAINPSWWVANLHR